MKVLLAILALGLAAPVLAQTDTVPVRTVVVDSTFRRVTITDSLRRRVMVWYQVVPRAARDTIRATRADTIKVVAPVVTDTQRIVPPTPLVQRDLRPFDGSVWLGSVRLGTVVQDGDGLWAAYKLFPDSIEMPRLGMYPSLLDAMRALATP